MNTPTEPGYYWWTPPRGKPRIAEAVRAHGMLMADIEPGTPWFTLLEAVKGEWGPRIPAPDRLRAMEEVCEREPVANTGYARFCDICLSHAVDENDMIVHAPTCPWPRARPPKPKEKP